MFGVIIPIIFIAGLVFVSYFTLNQNKMKLQMRSVYLNSVDLEKMFNQRNRIVFALVETLKEYLGEDNEMLMELEKLRAAARANPDIDKRVVKENELKEKINEVFTFCRKDPKISSVKEIQRLDSAMRKWDRDVLKAKDLYNDEAMKFNKLIRKKGTSGVAKMLKTTDFGLYDYKDPELMSEQEKKELEAEYALAEKEAADRAAAIARDAEEKERLEKEELERIKQERAAKRKDNLFEKDLEDMSIEEMEQLLKAYEEKEAAEKAAAEGIPAAAAEVKEIAEEATAATPESNEK